MTAFSRVLVLGLALAGCSSSSSDGETIDDAPLSGKVGSQSWTFQVGATNALLSQGDEAFVAGLYATSYTPCVDTAPRGNYLIASIPKQPGTYPLSLLRNITFAVGAGDNLIGVEGELVVDEVTATTVTGGLRTRYDDGNDVNGRFQITICPLQ